MMNERQQPIIVLEKVGYTYPSRRLPCLLNIDWQVKAGEFVLLTGATGCGKSTLLKLLNGLIPHESGGRLSGEVRIAGAAVRQSSVAELSLTTGMMFQSPDDQIFSTTAGDEVAFILENAGLPEGEIKQRVAESLALVGLAGFAERSVQALSGGQKQRLALAAVIAARPKILALDEPISQLDPQGAADLLEVVRRLNREMGITVVIVEHRLHEVLPLCDRVVLMEQGRIVWDGTPQAAYRSLAVFEQYGLRLPQTVQLGHRLGVAVHTAEVSVAVKALQRAYPLRPSDGWNPPVRMAGGGAPVIAVKNLRFAYTEAGPPVLQDVSWQVAGGTFVALMGNNGAGKSTLLQQLAGLLKPQRGEVRILGQTPQQARRQIGMVMQNPDLMLFNPTVREEVAFAMRQQGQAAAAQEATIVIKRLGLTGLEEDFPLALSRGQRLRVAIAAVMAARPAVLLLDEPTTGQDIAHIEDVIDLLQEYTRQGGTVIFCTHDTEVAARYADRIVVMSGGVMLADGRPRDVLCCRAVLQEAGLKAPPVLQIARQWYGGSAVSVEEVVEYVEQHAAQPCG